MHINLAERNTYKRGLPVPKVPSPCHIHCFFVRQEYIQGSQGEDWEEQKL